MATTLTPVQLLTLDELATYLQIPKKTIYGWRTTGRGPRALKVGGALRFRLADVDSWLDAQAEDAA